MTWEVYETACSEQNWACIICPIPLPPFRVGWTWQELLHLSLAGVGCERMLETRRFWVGWSWTVGELDWPGALASPDWVSGKYRGSSQISEGAKQGPESGNNDGEKQRLRKQLLKWKIHSGNRRLQTKWEATRMERKWNQGRNETFNPNLKQSLFFFFPLPFKISVGILRWICYLNWVKALFFFFRATGQWHKSGILGTHWEDKKSRRWQFWGNLKGWNNKK